MDDNDAGTGKRARAAAEDRQAWEKPALRKIPVKDAETGILFGPEILILLS